MRSTSEDVRKLEPGRLQEALQALIAVRPELGDDLSPPIGDLRAYVVQHHGLRGLIHDDLASGRQEGEALLHRAFDSCAGVSRQRPKPAAEVELLAVIADKVQDGQHSLVSRAAQASPQLLQEDGGALGGSEEED